MKKFLESFKENYIGILLMIAAALSTSLGQLFWKLSQSELNISLIVGFALYFFGALIMIIAFRFGSLSVLHPLLSMGYLFAILFGSIFLDELINVNMIIGTTLILIGVVFIGGGDH
ncbi:EamA/RhaT family transporter [Metabacillus idriensis]|uniref:EamA/RhaT family transporter n=1 Tax=Metabacillus idriensis TaxID=324768 RepID=UPI00174868F6|nr:EamA/RhaT family transporter [Metabacillus idriensis]